MKHFVLILATALLLTFPAAADQATPLLFNRARIIVMRTAVPLLPPSLPWLAPQGKDDPGATFDVEVRDALTLYNQEGWFNLSSPSDNEGVLMLFSAPTVSAITRISNYTPLDILMADREGTIVQILPSLKLSELAQDILPPSPVLAFLFLNGGAAARRSIHPGDRIEYSAFQRPPAILSKPALSPSAGQAPPPPIPEKAQEVKKSYVVIPYKQPVPE